MGVLGDHRQCAYVKHTYPPSTAQHSSRAQQLWNEWEIQCLVVVSFALQVFLLFSAGLRRRHRFRVLTLLLWLAYLSADHVAVFALGRLTLLHPSHQLLLFCAPFLLLHLGGQETITAFSMEDCVLWKRHLLNLTTQLALAIYVVRKQWRGDSKQLVAPMVLLFISATIKFAERACALWRAGLWSPGCWLNTGTGTGDITSNRRPRLEKLALIFSPGQKKENNVERLMEAAGETFQDAMEVFMDVKIRSLSGILWDTDKKVVAVAKWFTSSQDGAKLAYKLTDIHLSLIHDYLYTKFGSLWAVFYKLTTLALTSAALALFLVAGRPRVEVDHKDDSGAASVTTFLLGAVALEISSIFMWLMSSHWPYLTAISYLRGRGRSRSRASQCAGRIFLGILRRLRPGELGSSELEWSGKMQQYNMIDECIQKKRPVRWLEPIFRLSVRIFNGASPEFIFLARNPKFCLDLLMRCVGVKQAYAVEHVVVPPEVKDVLLDKLREVATFPGSAEKLAFNSFHGEWAAAWAARHKVPSHSRSATSAAQRVFRTSAAASKKSAAQQALEHSHIKDMDIVPSALVWHLVTDMCLLDDDDQQTPCTNRFRTCSQHLSNYVMYLVGQCKLMVDSEGHIAIGEVEYMMDRICGTGDDKRRFIQKVRDGDLCTVPMAHVDFARLIARRVTSVASELMKSEAQGHRWELIATVWVEMLCYIARNSGSAFHAKQLSVGGEFLTHAKLLVFLLLHV